MENVPIIKFINTKSALVSCKCCKNQLLNYEEISDKFFLDIKNHEYDFKENFVCQKHHKKVFKYYCEKCELNLDEDGLKNHKCHIKYLKDLKIYASKESEINGFLKDLD